MGSEITNLGEMGHVLTLRMVSVVEGLKDKYASLYNTSDFISKINYMQRCDSDAVGSVQAELIRMFDACGIKGVERGRSVSYYNSVLEESNIPSPKEMTHNVYKTFFEEFKDNPYPLPEEYISRIVDSRIRDEWQNDTLRVKILKKFIADANGLTSAGYNKCLFAVKYVAEKTGNNSLSWNDVEDIIAGLDDGVFKKMEEELSLSKEKQNKLEQNEEYVDYKSKIRERKKALRKTEEYKNLPEEKKSGFIEKDEEIVEYKKRVKPIDEAIKREENNRKEKCKKNGKFALLKIADDLASGRFGNANVVREEIYLFSIVFELMYFTGDSEEIVMEEDKARDIEKVMFGDYYTNNIMRYISAGHNYIKSGGEQQNPTGKGINYKNYMETIFLYFMRRWDLSIVEKISEIYKMAKEVHAEYIERGEDYRDNPNNSIINTQLYSDNFKKKVLETKEQFKEFLISNYDCSLPPETTPVFSVEIEQNTALEEYYQLIEDAEEFGVESDYSDRWTLAFLSDEVDVETVKIIYEDREKGKIDYDEVDDKTKFDILLYEVNKDIGKKKSERELDKKIISRADILRLFYQIYIKMNDCDDDETMRSFPDVYDDFSDLANQHLNNALLRPINGRDLYDLILVYSAYCNINEDKFD